VVRQRDYRNQAENGTAPPEDWGPVAAYELSAS
jgi:hypothetical protein